MPGRPPVEKLPLSARKNIRDEWDAKKGGLEDRLTDILGAKWTFEVDPHSLYAYTTDDNNALLKERPGFLIHSTIESALEQLRKFAEEYGEDGKGELNTVASAHVLAVAVASKDEPEFEAISTVGCSIRDGAKLCIVYEERYIGYNSDQSLVDLADVLNAAGTPQAADAKKDEASAQGAVAGRSDVLEFKSRVSIRKEYAPKIEAVRERIAKAVAVKDIKLEPGFEANYKKLKAAKEAGINRDWPSRIGYMTLVYFDGLAGNLERQKFPDDDLLQEGFQEAVVKGTIGVRVVDKLLNGAKFNQVQIEDGVLWIQVSTVKVMLFFRNPYTPPPLRFQGG